MTVASTKTPSAPLWVSVAFFLTTALELVAANVVQEEACKGKQLVPSQPSSCGGPNAIVELDAKVSRINRTHFGVSGLLHVKKPVGPPIKLLMKGKYCRSASNPLTCSNSMEIPIPDVCKRIDDENAMWADFLEKMMQQREGEEPVPFRRACPMEPGTYSVDNYVLSEQSLCGLFPFKGMWEYKSYVNGDEGCFNMKIDVH